jgi:hypothetical protein
MIPPWSRVAQGMLDRKMSGGPDHGEQDHLASHHLRPSLPLGCSAAVLMRRRPPREPRWTPIRQGQLCIQAVAINSTVMALPRRHSTGSGSPPARLRRLRPRYQRDASRLPRRRVGNTSFTATVPAPRRTTTCGCQRARRHLPRLLRLGAHIRSDLSRRLPGGQAGAPRPGAPAVACSHPVKTSR